MTRRKHGAATVRIGTSGWHYAHWKGPFYPASMPNHQFLSFYTTHYTTVELNNPFYRIPTEKTFAAWRENTPSGILFAVKANRRFTHIKKLQAPQPELDALLKRHAVAFCIYELNHFLSPLEVTADFSYIRLHGPGGPYQGQYDDGSLSEWARRIAAWHDEGIDTYCYFDNDQAAYATQDARRLREKVERLIA